MMTNVREGFGQNGGVDQTSKGFNGFSTKSQRVKGFHGGLNQAVTDFKAVWFSKFAVGLKGLQNDPLTKNCWGLT